MKSVFARISTAIVAVAAVAASALIAISPASATASTTNVTKISYTMAWQPGGTIPVTMDSTRVDINAQYQYRNAGSLVGHALTVGTLATGMPSGKSLYDYAYVTFFTSNDMTGRISFTNPCGTGTTDGVQLNAAGSGGQCTTVNVPANTVAIEVSYTSAFNGSTGSYSNYIPAGTNITATPRVYDNGTLMTATGIASGAAAPAGLFYTTDMSYSTVQGFHTSVTLPSTGTITRVNARQSICVDFSGFRSASNDTIVAALKINGTPVDSMNSDYAWGLAGGSSFPLYGNTLSTAGNSSVAMWETNHVAIVQTNVGGTIYSPTPGSTVTPTTEVTKGSTNVVVSCAPSMPTATGTLGTNAGQLSFTPDASFAGTNWVVNVYRNDNDVLVGSGQGSSANSTTVNGIASMYAPPSAIPTGVPMYARVAISRSISDSYGGGGTSFNSDFSTAKSAVYTLPVPVVSFPTNPSGLTTEGKAGITNDTMSYAAQVPTMSFLYDNMSGMGPKRTPYTDEKGGYWYWNDNVTLGQNFNATGSLKLYHYTQAGVDAAFAGGNGATLETTPEYTFLRMGWAGDRDHWVAAVTKDSTVYGNGNTPWSDYHYGLDVITGTMNGTFTKKSYTYGEMDAFCGSVYPNSLHKNNSVSVINNPTSDPWLMINCSSAIDSNMVNANRVAYAKSTSAGLVSLFAFNNTDPTVDNYTTIVGGTVYPNASASTDTAVVAMFATGRATTSSQMNSGGAAVVKRGLVRITKGGTATVLVGEAAWHEASASTSTSGVSSNASFLSLPAQSANGSLLGLMKNGSNYAILNAGTSGGFATVTSADNITYDEVSAPAAYAMQSSLAWGRGGSNIVGLSTAPVLSRTSMGMGMTPSYNLAQAKLDWSTRKVSTQEIISYVRPSTTGVVASTFVDMNGRLVLAYTKAENQLGFVRWAGASALPDGVNVTSQSTSYVINAGGDVVLTGTGLGATSGATKVTSATVNGVAATIKSRTATSLTITAPANNTATAQSPVTGNIELGFPGDQGGVVGQLTYVGATKLTPVITQTVSGANTAYFGDADRDLSVSVAMTPGAALTATTTSNSAVCTIVGTKVHFVAAGTCTVTSTVAAGGYYNAATPAVNTITVNKPTPTITLSVGELTAFASDADRTITATATLDTNGTAPAPVVTATPATVCTIVSGKVHFVTAGSCVVKAAIAASAAINADTETATIVVTKVTPTVSVSIDGASSAFTDAANRNITFAATAGTATLTSKNPLVCAIVPAIDQTPVQVKFVGTGLCIVKAQVAASATLNASTVVESSSVTVRKRNVITANWATGMAANASADASGAPLSSIILASGADPIVTSPTPSVCEYQSDGTVWIKGRDLTCTIHIETPASDNVWGAQSLDWTFTTLPAIGDSADSALLVGNDGVVVPLASTAVSWKQSTSTVKLVLYSKSSVGVMRGRIVFTGRDNVEYTCYSNFGSNAKATAATLNTVRAYTSGALCADTAGHTAAEKTYQATALQKLKELVVFNTGLGQGTVVKLSYKWEKHRASSGALRDGELPLDSPNRTWTPDSFASLYYLALDKATASLPTGASLPISSDAGGAVAPVIAFDSKRLDYTITTADADKCDVTADGRIWGKVADANCVITVATTNNTVWKAKSVTLTVPMVAAVGANANSAPIAPSNATAITAGPLTFTWNQATNALIAKYTARQPGKVTATMTFKDITNADVTCTVNFGSAAALAVAARGSYVAQTSVAFCTDVVGLSAADKTAQAAKYTKFKAAVAAKKTAAAVLPVTISYKFERHDVTTGALQGSALADLTASVVNVKLNYRATAN